MEEPGYNKASAVFQNNGCIIECVPVDKDGLCTEKLLGALRKLRFLSEDHRELRMISLLNIL